MTAQPAPADAARDLESQLDAYPDERGEILLEAANSWQHAGEHGRAIELLNEAIAIGGEDGQHARTALADVLSISTAPRRPAPSSTCCGPTAPR